jgi:hypothetical protein
LSKKLLLAAKQHLLLRPEDLMRDFHSKIMPREKDLILAKSLRFLARDLLFI